MRAVILLAGAKGSGKSTVGSMIKELYPDTVEIALADKLKKVCADVFKLDRALFDKPELKELPFEIPKTLNIFQIRSILEAFSLESNLADMKVHEGKIFDTPRKILQYIGSEVLRNSEPDIHCLFASNNIGKEGIYVVSDVRFLNELGFFKTNYPKDCHCFYIHRSTAELAASMDGHISEKGFGELAKRCRVINNNCELDELNRRVEGIFEDLLENVLELK